MTRIGILYKVEELIKDKTPEERYQERQKQSRPVVEALFEWLHSMEDSVDRSSLIGDAILYTLNQENYLRRYLDDGHLSIDNNSAERAIKNFAVGRRNWLFAKSIRGADASAVVYSIAETALLNGLKPYVYLSYVLDELRKMGPCKTCSLHRAWYRHKWKKDVFGMYVGENKSAKFWISIVNGLKNRGVGDILITCVDGLNGFPQAIEVCLSQNRDSAVYHPSDP